MRSRCRHGFRCVAAVPNLPRDTPADRLEDGGLSWAVKQENLCIVLGSEGQVMDPLCRLYASLPVHHHTANETTP